MFTTLWQIFYEIFLMKIKQSTFTLVKLHIKKKRNTYYYAVIPSTGNITFFMMMMMMIYIHPTKNKSLGSAKLSIIKIQMNIISEYIYLKKCICTHERIHSSINTIILFCNLFLNSICQGHSSLLINIDLWHHFK